MIRSIIVAILAVSSLSTCPAVEANEKPNFVFLIAEDVSKHHFELFDENGTETPNIRALAESGLIYKHAFSNSPVCSVARTTLMTGCYAPMIGGHHHRTVPKVELPAFIKFFPTSLREAGYYTTNKHKTDYNVTGGDAAWDESSKTASWRNRVGDQPFFHMQTFTVTHEGRLHFPESDLQDKPFKGLDKVFVQPRHPDTDLFRYTRARLHQNIRTMDQRVGQVVERLREDGLLENTYIFFFGDHGGVLPGSKGYVYETGLHIPLVVRVPEKYRESDQSDVNPTVGQTIEQFVSFVDFGPTLLNLAGVTVPSHVSGRPFLGPDVDHDAVRNSTFGYADRFDERIGMVRSVRIGNYKYIRNYQPWYFDGLQNNYRYKMAAYQQWREMFKSGKLNDVQSAFFKTSPVQQLYDIDSDPYETKNLALLDDYDEKLKELDSILRDQQRAMSDIGFLPESYLRTLTKEITLYELSQALNQNPVQLPSHLPARRAGSHEADSLGFMFSSPDPAPKVLRILADADDPYDAAVILNAIVALRDGEKAYEIPVTKDSVHPKVLDDKNVKRRLEYLTR